MRQVVSDQRLSSGTFEPKFVSSLKASLMAAARTAILLCVLSVSLVPNRAIGQIAEGRSGSSTVQAFGQDVALNELIFFGRCFALRNRTGALSLLATRPSSREEAEAYRALFGREGVVCLTPGTTLRVSLSLVRGSIAEGLLRSNDPLPDGYLLPAPSREEVRNLSDAARCYTNGHRERATVLLRTTPGTRAEFDAVSALMPEFENCMPEGVRGRFDATVIRYRIAEALLRLPSVNVAPGN